MEQRAASAHTSDLQVMLISTEMVAVTWRLKCGRSLVGMWGQSAMSTTPSLLPYSFFHVDFACLLAA